MTAIDVALFFLVITLFVLVIILFQKLRSVNQSTQKKIKSLEADQDNLSEDVGGHEIVLSNIERHLGKTFDHERLE